MFTSSAASNLSQQSHQNYYLDYRSHHNNNTTTHNQPGSINQQHLQINPSQNQTLAIAPYGSQQHLLTPSTAAPPSTTSLEQQQHVQQTQAQTNQHINFSTFIPDASHNLLVAQFNQSHPATITRGTFCDATIGVSNTCQFSNSILQQQQMTSSQDISNLSPNLFSYHHSASPPMPLQQQPPTTSATVSATRRGITEQSFNCRHLSRSMNQPNLNDALQLTTQLNCSSFEPQSSNFDSVDDLRVTNSEARLSVNNQSNQLLGSPADVITSSGLSDMASPSSLCSKTPSQEQVADIKFLVRRSMGDNQQTTFPNDDLLSCITSGITTDKYRNFAARVNYFSVSKMVDSNIDNNLNTSVITSDVSATTNSINLRDQIDADKTSGGGFDQVNYGAIIGSHQGSNNGNKSKGSGSMDGKKDKNLSSNSRNSESPRTKFYCPTCNKGFTEKFNMKRHMQIHFPSREKYECNECSKSFAWKDNFIRHKKAAHSSNVQQCAI